MDDGFADTLVVSLSGTPALYWVKNDGSVIVYTKRGSGIGWPEYGMGVKSPETIRVQAALIAAQQMMLAAAFDPTVRVPCPDMEELLAAIKKVNDKIVFEQLPQARLPFPEGLL